MRTLIIDDDPKMRSNHRGLLENYFANIEVIGETGRLDKAVPMIKELQPDLILLDIELEDGTGFQVLQQTKEIQYQVIFITAFNDFAIQAFKYSALDYLLKPVNEFEFKAAIEKVQEQFDANKLRDQKEHLLSGYEERQFKKIVLKTSRSIHLVDLDEIIFCQSDNTYTTFFLTDGEKILVSRSMKEFEEILTPKGFFRPHTSYLVNLDHVKRLDKSDGGFLIMDSGSEIPVSVRRKNSLMQRLENL